MSDNALDLVTAISDVARQTPSEFVRMVAAKLGRLDGALHAGAVDGLVADVGSNKARARLRKLLHRVASTGGAPAPAALALALGAAARTDDWHRLHQSKELVWSGPKPLDTMLRRTDQALLELIGAAQRELFIVTFAAYRVPALVGALVAAAARGVRLEFLLESPADGGTSGPDPVQALGEQLRACSVVWRWPRDKRKTDLQGKVGSLHAKCAIADDTHLLVSSANLTEFAFELNMELGVLVVGGEMPAMVKGHFEMLKEDGWLVRVDQGRT